MREWSANLGLGSVDLGFERWKCEWLGELGVTDFHDGEKYRASRGTGGRVIPVGWWDYRTRSLGEGLLNSKPEMWWSRAVKGRRRVWKGQISDPGRYSIRARYRSINQLCEIRV